jgi:hypothetical protein
VVLQATAGGTIPAGSSITIVYTGSIANSSSISGTNGLSCVIGGAPGCPGSGTPTSSFVTSASGTQFTVQFAQSVTFTAADYLEVSQVRMNVNGLGSATTTVSATLSGTSSAPTTNPITFTQSQVGVASIVAQSVKGSIPSGGGASPIQTCAVPITGNSFTVTAAELYPAALTSTADENAFTAITAAANGSLVNITLTNVPSGMAVQANTYTATTNGATIVTASGGSTANAVAFGTAQSGFTGTTAYPVAPALGYTVSLSSSTAAYQSSSGSALTWTFSVTNDSTSALESFSVQFAIGLPNSKNTGLNATIAPLPAIGTIVTVTAAVSLTPASGIVSFATNNEGGGTVATISDCVTNMLFPYVTNQGGYDTSYSIANTTNDDLAFGAGAGASAQSGSCTLTIWPTTDTTLAAASPLGTASQYTTPSIPSGSVYAFSQSATSFSGQSGYVIAVCRFLNAHGFAFLTNGFAQSAGPQLSHGYLGLILPNPIAGRSNSNGEMAVQ